MDKEEVMSGFVEFDKHIVGINSLEILLHCLKSVKEKVTYWQWIYISLHSAVQAYMVLALTGSNSLMTYKKDDMKKWMKSYDTNGALPKYELDFFDELYKKTKTSSFEFYTNTQVFVPSPSQDENIFHLNKLRKGFVHFIDDSLSLILGEVPFQLVTDCLDYIEFLAFQSNNIFWFEEQYKTETERLLAECRSVVNSQSGNND